MIAGCLFLSKSFLVNLVNLSYLSRDTHRWPLIIDETGQASIFVRYSDTNYLNAVNPSNMEPERMRCVLFYDMVIECGIFGEGSQISANQKREKSAFSPLIG